MNSGKQIINNVRDLPGQQGRHGIADLVILLRATSLEKVVIREGLQARRLPHCEAATLGREEIKHLVTLTVDVVIHMTREVVYDAAGERIGYERFVDEVYFDPWAKMQARFGNKTIEPSSPVPA